MILVKESEFHQNVSLTLLYQATELHNMTLCINIEKYVFIDFQVMSEKCIVIII